MRVIAKSNANHLDADYNTDLYGISNIPNVHVFFMEFQENWFDQESPLRDCLAVAYQRTHETHQLLAGNRQPLKLLQE